MSTHKDIKWGAWMQMSEPVRFAVSQHQDELAQRLNSNHEQMKGTATLDTEGFLSGKVIALRFDSTGPVYKTINLRGQKLI